MLVVKGVEVERKERGKTDTEGKATVQFTLPGQDVSNVITCIMLPY